MKASKLGASTLPLVTVVTPSYNQGRFIRETIESVLSQDYPHIEYMVIDGGSTDETLSILNSYEHRFFWVSEPDRGQAHAINKGWQRAKGDVLAWLNSDDIYLPGAIAKAVDYLIRNQQVGMVYGDAYYVAEDGRVIKPYPTEPFDANRLVDTCTICQPAAFIRRAVIDDIGYLDDSLNLCIDYDLWIRISRNYSLGHLSEYLAKSRLHAECKTVKQRVAAYKEALEMLYRHYGFVPPSWACGYAYRALETRFNSSASWKNPVFVLGLITFCSWNFLRYNYRMPLVELGRWVWGLREGIKKLFAAHR